jgi:outer membrane protein insertion porin family
LAYAQSVECVGGAALPPDSVQKTRITILDVEFQGEDPLADGLRADLVKEIQQQELWVTLQESDVNWVDEAVNPIRAALSSQGYFKVSVEGTPYLVHALATERLYVLRVEVESGRKYTLGKIRFVSTSDTPLVFTEALLREQIPLQEGELFDTSKIRDGLEAIGRLYGSKGYIDATPEPDTTIDDKTARINILVKVDEERRYSIGRIGFLGMGLKTENELKLPQESGDIPDISLWRKFFEDNKSHLPPGATPQRNLQFHRNVRNTTVDITLDFQPCPQFRP